jgi:lysophospholipase L1-like esterase
LKTAKALFQGVALGVTICALTAKLPAQTQIDFSKLVVVGDSLAAGVENGSLEASQQNHGFSKLLARQIHTGLVLPLVPYPGAPNTLELVSASFPPVIKPVPGKLLFPRLNPFDEVTDLAVPLQTVDDALNRKPDKNLNSTDQTQLATDIVLGFPCPLLYPCPINDPALSQIDRAVSLHPTTIVVDIGNNDILGAVTSGQFGSIGSSPAALQAFLSHFAASYAEAISKLAGTGATLIVANLPDVIESAYFIPITKLAPEVKVPVDQLAALLGTTTADYLTLDAVPTVEAILSGAQSGPLPASCPSTSSTPCVVNAADAAGIRQVIIALNNIIKNTVAAVPGAVLIDAFSLTDQLYTNGYKIGRQTLTADFLGGLFSLDGLHLSNTGYAIFANLFIQQINQAYGTNIRQVNVREVAERDPLVLANPWWD